MVAKPTATPPLSNVSKATSVASLHAYRVLRMEPTRNAQGMTMRYGSTFACLKEDRSEASISACRKWTLGQCRGVGAPMGVGPYRKKRGHVAAPLVDGHDAQPVVAQQPLERVAQRPHRVGNMRLGPQRQHENGAFMRGLHLLLSIMREIAPWHLAWRDLHCGFAGLRWPLGTNTGLKQRHFTQAPRAHIARVCVSSTKICQKPTCVWLSRPTGMMWWI